MNKFDFKKAVQSLNYFAEKEGGEINKMKALKLIWLSDRTHLRKYGKLLTADTYYALKLGPIPSFTKDLADYNNTFLDEEEKSYRDKYIIPSSDNLSYRTAAKTNLKVFSKTNLEIMDKVYEVFGKLNEFELSEVSHKFPEWKKHKIAFDSGVGTRFDIDYSELFDEPEDESLKIIDLDVEDIELSKEAFKETNSNAGYYYG